jgi:hypothetical protein
MHIGITGRYEDILQPPDVEVIKRAGINALKTYDLNDRDYSQWLTVFTVPTSGIGYPDDYCDLIKPVIKKAYKLGIRHFTLHQYPNTSEYGYRMGWQNGTEFAVWWQAVHATVKKGFKDCRWGFPACEPGCSVGSFRGYSEDFFKGATAAIEIADYYELTWHWKDREEMEVGLWRVDSYIAQWPDKVLMVEFSNPNSTVSKVEKGEQYLYFYNELSKRRNVVAAFAFCVSSADPLHKYVTWRRESGKFIRDDIAKIIGGRDF